VHDQNGVLIEDNKVTLLNPTILAENYRAELFWKNFLMPSSIPDKSCISGDVDTESETQDP